MAAGVVAAAALAWPAAPAAAAVRAVAADGGESVRLADDSVRITNTLKEAVNVYAASNAGEVFVGRVEAGATVALTVRGAREGQKLQARATTVSGTQSYSRADLVVGSKEGWSIP